MSTPAVDDLTVVAVVGGSVVDGSENHYNNADTLLMVVRHLHTLISGQVWTGSDGMGR